MPHRLVLAGVSYLFKPPFRGCIGAGPGFLLFPLSLCPSTRPKQRLLTPRCLEQENASRNNTVPQCLREMDDFSLDADN